MRRVWGLRLVVGRVAFIKTASLDADKSRDVQTAGNVEMRRFPYPYRAMLAICSDLDGIPDGFTYFSMIKYLNTDEETAFGKGIGLEVGNTIYFCVSPQQFSYNGTNDLGRENIRRLIRSGHIDCLHSFGTRITTRVEASDLLGELAGEKCYLKVWVDHATAPTNYGSDITKGNGDVVGESAYHADLTTAYGIKYIWRGRVTSVIGQNVKRKLFGIGHWQHPIQSGITLAKEVLKGVSLSPRYEMNRQNTIMREIKLRNGQPAIEFIRSNPHWRGITYGATVEGLKDVLSARTLERLIERGGVSILYTHLGIARDRYRPFGQEEKDALSILASLAKEKKILVTTTRKLLDYCFGTSHIEVSSNMSKGLNTINIDTKGRDISLDGLSLYANTADNYSLYVDGKRCENLSIEQEAGSSCISIPWHKNEFPELDSIESC